MKECGVPEDTITGMACKKISGLGIESCVTWQAVKVEIEKQKDAIEDLPKGTSSIAFFVQQADRLKGCPFREEILVRLKQLE